MKRIALIIAATLAMGTALRAQEPDARYRLLHYEWTLNADGSTDYHYRHEVQILRNRALTAYADKGETFVTFNPDLEQLTVNEVYTLRADGSRVEMPRNAFVYQLPEECVDCGRFNHMRELAMVHTGMEIGCTVVVDYTIHRQSDLIYEQVPLMRECPVDRLEIVVTTPDPDALQIATYDKGYLAYTQQSVVTSSNGGLQTVAYTFTDLPQAPAEPYMPADIVPRLKIFNRSPEYLPAFDQQGIPQAANTVAALTNTGNMQANIKAIQEYVVNNIHLNDIKPIHLGYTHATAQETYRTGCGTATDKAVLLAAMLNEAGYAAHVLGETGDQVGVRIDTLEYLLDTRRKGPLSLIGKAVDEVTTINEDLTVEAALDTLEDGFYRLAMGDIKGLPVRPSTLTLGRTTPLEVQPVNYRSTRTITLPKGLSLVGGGISRKFQYDGIGSLEVSVKQSGTKLKVVRNLTIEKSLIMPADYANFRQLMVEQNIPDLILRSK